MSPSSRRAWIEIVKAVNTTTFEVVALLTEGVDRNVGGKANGSFCTKSPSSRRAWIEIGALWTQEISGLVALLTEGVDRNLVELPLPRLLMGRPPHGGRG